MLFHRKKEGKYVSAVSYSIISMCKKIGLKPVTLLVVGAFFVLFNQNLSITSTSQQGLATETKKSSERTTSAYASYKHFMKSLRPPSDKTPLGPLALSSLPSNVQDQFRAFNTKLMSPGEFASQGQSRTQVAEQGWPFMDYDKKKRVWSSKWSRDLVDAYLKADSRGEDISCKDYPGSAAQIKTALEFSHGATMFNNEEQEHHDRRILVAGSISPWVEALILNSSMKPQSVFVTDYNPIVSEDPRIQFIHMDELKSLEKSPEYDIIVSYSSIEHDGIGRYGDPINPMGDMAAMAEYHTMLKDGGILILGVPVVASDNMSGKIDCNWHRIYSMLRLQKLMCGFQFMRNSERIEPPGMALFNGTRSVSVDWQYQPVFVLKKTNHVKCYLDV